AIEDCACEIGNEIFINRHVSFPPPAARAHAEPPCARLRASACQEPPLAPRSRTPSRRGQLLPPAPPASAARAHARSGLPPRAQSPARAASLRDRARDHRESWRGAAALSGETRHECD